MKEELPKTNVYENNSVPNEIEERKNEENIPDPNTEITTEPDTNPETDPDTELAKHVEDLKLIMEDLSRRLSLEEQLATREMRIGQVLEIDNQAKSIEGIKGLDPKSPFKDYDFEQLVPLNIDETDEIDLLKKVDLLILGYSELNYSSEDDKFEINQLHKIQASLIEMLNQKINKAKSDLLDKLSGAASQFREYIEEIQKLENDPTVLNQLMDSAIAENNKLEQEIVQKSEEILNQSKRYLASLTDKHNNSLAKISEIYGGDINIEDINIKDLEMLIPKIITKIIIEIMLKTGDEQKIKKNSDIIPWKVTTGLQYMSSLKHLKDPALNFAIKVLVERKIQSGIDFEAQLKEQLKLNKFLYSLFESPLKVKYSNFAPPVTLNDSFSRREENDLSGDTQKILDKTKSAETQSQAETQAQAAKEKAKEEAIEAILAKEGGFKVEGGAVVVKQFISRNGNTTLIIDDVAGIDRSNVRKTSPQDGQSFPEFIRKKLPKLTEIPKLYKDTKKDSGSEPEVIDPEQEV